MYASGREYKISPVCLCEFKDHGSKGKVVRLKNVIFGFLDGLTCAGSLCHVIRCHATMTSQHDVMSFDFSARILTRRTRHGRAVNALTFSFKVVLHYPKSGWNGKYEEKASKVKKILEKKIVSAPFSWIGRETWDIKWFLGPNVFFLLFLYF